MQKTIAVAFLVIVLAVGGSTAVSSQQGAQLHDSQYPEVDIALGAGLYSARCAPCHGAQGDGIGGVNLRSGTFRNAITDRDLAGFIRAGSPTAGMPPFALDDTDMAGIIAYLRNMNSFDAGTVKAGNVAQGRAVFEGKGSCTKCHRVGRVGSHVGPNLTDIGSVRSAGALQRSLVEPTSQEEGFVNYDLHQGTEDPDLFYLYENWDSAELLDAHLAAPHLVEFAGRLDDLVAEPGLTITRLRRTA